eukprot:15364538-Ditylum_brightwellii.AAC.3
MHSALEVEDNHHRPKCRDRRKCRLGEDALERGRHPWQRGLKNLIAWSLYLQGFSSCESPRKTREQGGKGVTCVQDWRVGHS